jgi:hypothetical protein
MEPTERDAGGNDGDTGGKLGEAGFRPEDDPGTGMVAAFGRQLKLLRTAAGMERAELGRRLGYSASSIASYLHPVSVRYSGPSYPSGTSAPSERGR